MAANRDAIIEALERESIEYRQLENPSGWMLEVTSPVEGSEMERLLRLIDTQTNVQCIIIPNIGLSIQTGDFEEEHYDVPLGEVIHEADGGAVEAREEEEAIES